MTKFFFPLIFNIILHFAQLLQILLKKNYFHKNHQKYIQKNHISIRIFMVVININNDKIKKQFLKYKLNNFYVVDVVFLELPLKCLISMTHTRSCVLFKKT